MPFSAVPSAATLGNQETVNDRVYEVVEHAEQAGLYYWEPLPGSVPSPENFDVVFPGDMGLAVLGKQSNYWLDETPVEPAITTAGLQYVIGIMQANSTDPEATKAAAGVVLMHYQFVQTDVGVVKKLMSISGSGENIANANLWADADHTHDFDMRNQTWNALGTWNANAQTLLQMQGTLGVGQPVGEMSLTPTYATLEYDDGNGTNLVLLDSTGIGLAFAVGDPLFIQGDPGVSTQVLTSAGSGDHPTWADIPVQTKLVDLQLFEFSTNVTSGTGKAYYRVPVELDGFNLVSVGLQVGAAQSSSGIVSIELTRLRAATAGGARAAAGMLSVDCSVDANEWDSKDATTATVIDGTADDVQEGDLIRVDMDGVGTGTQGLFLSLGFNTP